MASLPRWLRTPVSLHVGLLRGSPLLGLRCFSFTSDTDNLATVSCAADGRKVIVKWTDGKESTFHAVWLRYNCQCSECVQHSSGQKLVTSTELGGGLRISETNTRGTIPMYSCLATLTNPNMYSQCLPNQP